MVDSFTRSTTTGWGGNIKKSITSALIGIVLFLASFPLLWWNEGNAVKTAKSLEQGKGEVVSITADKVDSSTDGKLVHLSAQATTDETLTDDTFGMSANALKLVRKVEMYQWHEHEHTETEKLPGGKTRETTTYTYETDWSARPIDSGSFEETVGHENPGAFAHEGRTLTAKKITLGAYTLNSGQVRRIESHEPLPATSDTFGLLSAPMKESMRLHQNGYYIPATPLADESAGIGSPEVGDLRITFSVVKPADVSIVAQQVGSTFEPFKADAGRDVDLLELGTLSAENMFENAIAENNRRTWVLRAVGFLCMFFGVVLIGSPLGALADVLPIFGNIMRGGVFILALAISIPLSLMVIGLAWLFYRPLLALVLIAAGIGVVVGIAFLVRSLFGSKDDQEELEMATPVK